MPITSRHPLYDDRLIEWQRMRDCKRGQSAVKGQSTCRASPEHYLPMPTGFRKQNDGGREMYFAYLQRAQFPGLVTPTLLGMVGLIHRIEAVITLPDALAHLYEKATPDGWPLEVLHRKITEELLLEGRYSLLVDVEEGGDGNPYLAGYTAEALINWSPTSDFFVLNETALQRTNFEWHEKEKYRQLELVGRTELTPGVYVQSEWDISEKTKEVTPKMRGGASFTELPFVVIGPTSLELDPDEPPLIGVADGALAIYRLDADYRHQLHNSGQETLVFAGCGEGPLPDIVGAGVVIGLPAGATAQYVGPSGVGIGAHRTAIVDAREEAIAAGARILDTSQKPAESGDALRLRQAAQAATIETVRLASAQGLERALRYAAMFVGADPNSVIVKHDNPLGDTTLSPADATALVGMWQGGAISYDTMYENLQRGKIASDERTADEERAIIETEPPPINPPPTPIPGASNQTGVV